MRRSRFFRQRRWQGGSGLHRRKHCDHGGVCQRRRSQSMGHLSRPLRCAWTGNCREMSPPFAVKLSVLSSSAVVHLGAGEHIRAEHKDVAASREIPMRSECSAVAHVPDVPTPLARVVCSPAQSGDHAREQLCMPAPRFAVMSMRGVLVMQRRRPQDLVQEVRRGRSRMPKTLCARREAASLHVSLHNWHRTGRSCRTNVKGRCSHTAALCRG
jgi:hypothetical protein